MENVFEKRRIAVFEPKGRPIPGVDLSFLKNCDMHVVFRFILDNCSSLSDIDRLNGFLPAKCQVFGADVSKLKKVRKAMNKPFISRENDAFIKADLAELAEGKSLTSYYFEFLSRHFKSDSVEQEDNKSFPHHAVASIYPSKANPDPRITIRFCEQPVYTYLDLYGVTVDSHQTLKEKGGSIRILMVLYEDKLTADLAHAIHTNANIGKLAVMENSLASSTSGRIMNCQLDIDADPFIGHLSKEFVKWEHLADGYLFIPSSDFPGIMNYQLKGMGFDITF